MEKKQRRQNQEQFDGCCTYVRLQSASAVRRVYTALRTFFGRKYPISSSERNSSNARLKLLVTVTLVLGLKRKIPDPPYFPPPRFGNWAMNSPVTVSVNASTAS